MIGFLLLAAALQQPVPPDVELQVMLRVFQGDRATASVTTGNNDVLGGSIWTDPAQCSVGSGDNGVGDAARVRWQFTGRILQHTGSTYTVELGWQREGGSYGNTPKSTQQLVLELGNPQVIDALTPSTPTRCGATAVRVEAAVVRTLPQRIVGGGFGAGAYGNGIAASGGRGRGAAAGGFGSGVGAATGGGAGGAGARGRGIGGGTVNGGGANANGASGTGYTDFWSTRGGPAMSALEIARLMAGTGNSFIPRVKPLPTVGGAAAGGARGVRVGPMWTGSSGLTPIASGSYDAELWLVHAPSGGAEETQHLAVHFDGDGDVVAFPLVTISTPNGSTSVDVAVSLRVMADEKGAPMLRVIIVRRIDGGAAATTGATTKVIPLPAANDTVSFELPQSGGLSASALADHPFSVRLRMGTGK